MSMLSIMFTCHKHFVCKLKTIRLQEVNGGGGSPRSRRVFEAQPHKDSVFGADPFPSWIRCFFIPMLASW
jgi:hypothetical protein